MGQLPLGLLWRTTVFWVESKGGKNTKMAGERLQKEVEQNT